MIAANKLNEVLKRLKYDFDNFELGHFIQHIETIKQREIILNAVPLEPSLTAMWIRAETVDYIFCNERLHPAHQRHSILHELAHIILNHKTWVVDDTLPAELIAFIESSSLQGRMRKNDPKLRTNHEEQEAEALAFLIQKKLLTANRISQLRGQSTSIQALRPWVDSMAFDE